MPSDEELDFSTNEEDIISIRRSLEQSENGESRGFEEVFDEIHEMLLLMKAEQERNAGLLDK